MTVIDGPGVNSRPTPLCIQARTPPQTRWRESAEFLRQSGGVLVLTARLTRDRRRTAEEFVEIDTDGDVRYITPSRPNDGWNEYVTTFARRMSRLYPGRLVGLYSQLPNWSGQGYGTIGHCAPHLYLPISSAPCELNNALACVLQQRSEAAEAIDFEPVQVGTDASRQRKGKAATWAWIDERGRHNYGTLRGSSIAVAELVAIVQSARSTREVTPLRIRSDSRVAVAAVQAMQRANLDIGPWVRRGGEDHRRVRAILEWACDEVPLRDLQITWVRGHAGDPLNEAANRLAIASRRAFDAGAAPSVRRRICAGIAQELLRELTPA